jgi:hypothetical protein|tara:strand:+ start:58 stop:900 length:843 start_codon:yes stop_codon:yes gene_type:complete
MSSQLLTAQDLATESIQPLQKAGTISTDYMGRTWAYVQASEALAQGDALVPQSYAIIDEDVSATAAADTRRVTGTGDFTTTALADMAGPLVKDSSGAILQHPNGNVYWLWINAAASQGQGGPIISRVDDDNVDVYWVNSNDGKIATGLTTTSDFVVFTTTRVKKSDAAIGVDTVGGFVQMQAGITDEYWFWALIKGWGLGKIDTSDAVIAAGEAIVNGTDDGTVNGIATGTAAQLAHQIGIGAFDQDADGVIPIYANCVEIFRALPEGPANIDKAYPAQV